MKNGKYDLRLKIPLLRFVIYPGEKYLIARCLEHDFAIQVIDPMHIAQEISGMISAQVRVALENGVKPFSNMRPAPGKYQKMWAKATRKEPEVSRTTTQEDNREYVSQLAYA